MAGRTWNERTHEEEVLDGLRMRSTLDPDSSIGPGERLRHTVLYTKIEWPLRSNTNTVESDHRVGPPLSIEINGAGHQRVVHADDGTRPFWVQAIRPGFRLTPDNLAVHRIEQRVVRPTRDSNHGTRALSMKISFGGASTHVFHNIRLG